MKKELQSLNDRIAERIGQDLVDLIPKEQWKLMVDSEIEVFKRDKFPVIVQELMKEAYLGRIKSEINKITLSTEWDSITQENIYTELEKFIGKSSGIIIAGMLSPAMQQILSDLRSRLGGY